MNVDQIAKDEFVPNIVVNDSAASRNSVVEMALSFSASTGTSTKDFRNVSRRVPPGGMTTAMIPIKKAKKYLLYEVTRVRGAWTRGEAR